MIITNLLTNMVVLTLFGGIPTNSPAFKDYAFRLMLSNAEAIAAKWRLDSSIIMSNKITRFEANPFPHGPTAGIVFGDRYVFGIQDGGCIGFSDGDFYSGAVFPRFTRLSDMERLRNEIIALEYKWLRATNHLNLKKARRIAEYAMRSVGIRIEKLPGFETPLSAKQMKINDDTTSEILEGGSVVVRRKERPNEYKLPYYEFRWETKRKRGVPRAVCEIHVSGITSNVVHFSFVGSCPISPSPTNYLEMLGLPSTTVFVKKRFTQPPTYELYDP